MDNKTRSSALSSMFHMIVGAFAYALEPMLDRVAEQNWRGRGSDRARGNGHRGAGISDLPPPVRAAAEKYFGATAGLKAMKGVEEGKTHYEVEGKKGGKNAEVTFDPGGNRTE